MELIHTLLLLIREDYRRQDLALTERCLKSLEKSAYTTVVVFNQGCLTGLELDEYLKSFRLNCIVIGGGVNTGTVIGRQSCFEYVYRQFPGAAYVSELHPDMIFTSGWENALVDYLNENPEEPVIGCGIISDALMPEHYPDGVDDYAAQFKRDRIERGFTLPCIHRITVLKAVGGYDARFLTGKHAFEDDSLLLGYHYYYGTRANWSPKVNCNSIVYHEVAGQRFGLSDDPYENFGGLLRQYGAMGVSVLADLHVSPWQVQFFTQKFSDLKGG